MLKNDQVEYIRNVLLNRGIETVDLLEEMTDHFVQAIEERESELPRLGLREMLRQEVAKFGSFGMMKLQEEYQRALEKEGLRILWRTFKSFWKIPQILASLAFLYAIFSCVGTFGSDAVSVFRFVLLANGLIILGVLLFIRYRLDVANLAIYRKLYSSLYVFLFPVLIFWNNAHFETDSVLSLKQQLIATALYGIIIFFQFAAGLILTRTFSEIKRQSELRRAKR